MVPLNQPKSNLFAGNSDTLKREPSESVGNKLPRANPSGSRKGQAEKNKKQPQRLFFIFGDLAGNRNFGVAPRLTIINCQLCRRGGSLSN